MTSLNKKMSVRHEDDVAEMLEGYRSKGSGSVWKDQMDGRRSRRDHLFAWAWDCKASLGRSIGVSRAMWEKAVEQAGGERPLLPLRFYDTQVLDVGLDLVVLSMDDFRELNDAASRADS